MLSRGTPITFQTIVFHLIYKILKVVYISSINETSLNLFLSNPLPLVKSMLVMFCSTSLWIIFFTTQFRSPTPWRSRITPSRAPTQNSEEDYYYQTHFYYCSYFLLIKTIYFLYKSVTQKLSDKDFLILKFWRERKKVFLMGCKYFTGFTISVLPTISREPLFSCLIFIFRHTLGMQIERSPL